MGIIQENMVAPKVEKSETVSGMEVVHVTKEEPSTAHADEKEPPTTTVDEKEPPTASADEDVTQEEPKKKRGAKAKKAKDDE